MRKLLSLLVVVLSIGCVFGSFTETFPIIPDDPNGPYGNYPDRPDCMPIYWTEIQTTPTLVGYTTLFRLRTDTTRYNNCDTSACSAVSVSGNCNPFPNGHEFVCGSPNAPCINCKCRVRTVHYIDEEYPENSYSYQECGCCNTVGCNEVTVYAPGQGVPSISDNISVVP